MNKEIKGVLAGAVIAGLLAGVQAWADEAPSATGTAPTATGGKKDSCKGSAKHKENCKGHHKKKSKDSCNGKDGCTGKDGKKADKPKAE